jgi:hypothetical protein
MAPAKPRRPRPDYQTDYEDPGDRLFRRTEGKRDKTPAKRPNPVATTAAAFGYTALVPCVGAVFGPLAVLLGILGRVNAARPNTTGKAKSNTGIWFGIVGCVLYILLPFGIYLWALTLR